MDRGCLKDKCGEWIVVVDEKFFAGISIDCFVDALRGVWHELDHAVEEQTGTNVADCAAEEHWANAAALHA